MRAASKKKTSGARSGNDAPQALNLFFTGKCNLNCTYCFVNKEGQEKTTLDLQSIKKSIDLFFEYPGRKKVISFNGGEPLMEWKVLKDACLYAHEVAKAKKISLDLVVVSNGTMINQEIVDFFIENKIILKISIDGKKATNDVQRPLLSGNGRSTFDVVMGNIGKIDWKGMPIAVSMVFTPRSLDDLVENIEFLAKKGFSSIDVYPDVHAHWTIADIAKLKRILKNFEKYYVSSFGSTTGKVFKNSLLDGIVNEVRLEKTESCPNVQLDPEGRYYVCDKVMSLPKKERLPYQVGNVREGLDGSKRSVLLEGLRNEIRKNAGLKCSGCKYVKYCFCPIGTHIFNKLEKGQDKDFWKKYCQVSSLLIGTFVNIANKLEYDERFVGMYRF